MSRPCSYLKISYAEYERMMDILVTILTEKIALSKPIDFIYGFARGGLPIAVHLSHHLGIPLTTSTAQLFTPPHLKKKTVLLVDDIYDTGNTIHKIIDRVDCATAYTAVLFYNPKNNKYGTTPTFYVQSTNNWIVFPWETLNSD